jgi:hypothetical protein
MSRATSYTESGTSPPDLTEIIRTLIREELDRRDATTRPESIKSVRIEEAMERMGWTRSWAYRNWTTSTIGGYKDDDGRLKIRADVLARHVKKHEQSTR